MAVQVMESLLISHTYEKVFIAFCGSVGDDRILFLHSKTSSTERAMVIGLGAVNLFGVIVLNTLLK